MTEKKIKNPEEIKARYLNGGSVSTMAREYGVSREAIYQVLRTMDDWEKKIEDTAPLRYKKSILKRHPSLDSKAIELKKGGMSTTQVSKTLSVPYRAVRGILKDTQYDDSKGAKQKRDKKILRKYNSGKTQVELAREFNTSQQNICRILDKYSDG
jgi:Mor family transcriptional regulator